ncbi:DUF2381 family protein [Archangium lansingense]|uniref:DUF2381 family protein n=1 Tax=Archangium lansingense TaxID=2995310 RepID=A0ABT4A254_9BACT|nr:DUF2381 family protein [Archangium lansinium]MCY1075426.1 DUF2381 family protein [Archangium lansinium]
MSPLARRPLLLALLTATSAPALPLSKEWDTPGVRHLELTAENAREQHPVRISPGQPTNLLFNAPLQPGGVTVEGEQWVDVAVNGKLGMVMLLPSGTLPGDKPLTVTVRFADGQVPASVTFLLVEHSTRAEHLVRVYRETRSCESHCQESRQQRERAERCEAELEQERSRPEEARPAGLTDLFDAGLVGEGDGIAVLRLTTITQRPGETLKVLKAWSYRAVRQGHVAVELLVENTGPLPWTAEGAELVSKEGVRLRVGRVWQPETIAPGAQRRLAVEAEATVEQTQGTFILELSGPGGAHSLTVSEVTFP